MIADNLKSVKRRVSEAARQAGRNPDSIQLVAVSKQVSSKKIITAYEAGAKYFGENKIQEAIDKIDDVNLQGVGWHFIGHLQKNKVNKCLGLFDAIDSVDSYGLAKKINTSSKNSEVITECLLEINTSNEPQKWGFSPLVSEDILSCFQLKNINIVGLMTIGPNTKNQKKIRKAFILLRNLN